MIYVYNYIYLFEQIMVMSSPHATARVSVYPVSKLSMFILTIKELHEQVNVYNKELSRIFSGTSIAIGIASLTIHHHTVLVCCTSF